MFDSLVQNSTLDGTWQGGDRAGKRSLGVMAAGEMLHEKKQATHRSATGTALLVPTGECERAGRRAYIVYRALLTTAKLEG